MAPMGSRKKRNRKSTPPFDVQQFLESAGAPQRVMKFERSATVFSQGDAATSVLYIQHGGIKLSVLSESGKEAVVERRQLAAQRIIFVRLGDGEDRRRDSKRQIG